MTARPEPPRGSTIELLATCAFGLESVVARELGELGFDATPLAEATGRVAWRVARADTPESIAAANLWLRAADRVLIRLAEFPVGGGDEGFEALYQGVRAIAWEEWLHPDAFIHVSGRCVRSTITSEPAAQRATKRAIVERLRAEHGLSPSGRLPESGPRVGVEVSILRDRASLTIDTTGVGLHKRGYRRAGRTTTTPGARALRTGASDAALRETMAAGLVLLSGWRPGQPLVDPFCGSGTIAIEAALWARSIAPGLGREFEAEHWWSPRSGASGPATKRLIDPVVWADAREEARGAIVADHLDPRIHASDIDEHALSLARANARVAGVEHDIQFLRRDARELTTTLDNGCVVTNPPYGERLGDPREIERLYRELPRVFRRLPTWAFHILTGRLDLETLFGQPAARRRKLYNSTIECAYFSFLPGVRPTPRTPDAPEAPGSSLSSPAEPNEPEVPAPDEPADISPDPGTEVDLAAPPQSPPAHRWEPMPTFGGLTERDAGDAADFERCLAKNLRHLRRYPARGITCYRVYERDVPDVPLIIDRYEDWFHAVEYERPHERTAAQHADWLDLLRAGIARAGGVPEERVVLKAKHRQRGLTQHEKQGESGQAIVVHEAGLRFEVNLLDYVDTGLFLDHRLTRGMVRERAAGARVLNLFCYTGAFTVYAAAGGAASSTSVDLSNTYLAWAERNMTLNGLATAQHRFVRSDVPTFLRSLAPAPGGVFDLAIIDPPTFSNSTSTQEDWEVGRGHVEVLGVLAPLMSPAGAAYFSNNFRRFKFDEAAVAAAGWRSREISARTVPPEYRNRRIHRCWLLERSPE